MEREKLLALIAEQQKSVQHATEFADAIMKVAAAFQEKYDLSNVALFGLITSAAHSFAHTMMSQLPGGPKDIASGVAFFVKAKKQQADLANRWLDLGDGEIGGALSKRGAIICAADDETG